MHRRNKYKTPPDFSTLSATCPELSTFLLTNGSIDFRDPKAIRALNKALLTADFNLHVELPEGKLCPTVANRLDYLLFIEDLLALAGVEYDGPRTIRGVDIGVGASCVYPLLGCRMHANWSFVGTEIDSSSLQTACDNVNRNGLVDRIQLLKVTDKEALLLDPIRHPPSENFHFCMCNPPFYSSTQEIAGRREDKKSESLHEYFDYSLSESVYPGGEVAFVQKMIEESLALREKFLWYSSLVGIKSSLAQLELILHQAKVPTIKVFPSLIGRTKRWILAWSFTPLRRFEKRRTPSGASLTLALPAEVKCPRTWLGSCFSELGLTEIPSSPHASATAYRATLVTWSRAARRREPHHINMTIHCSFRAGNIITFSCADEEQHLESLLNHLRRNAHANK